MLRPFLTLIFFSACATYRGADDHQVSQALGKSCPLESRGHCVIETDNGWVHQQHRVGAKVSQWFCAWDQTVKSCNDGCIVQNPGEDDICQNTESQTSTLARPAARSLAVPASDAACDEKSVFCNVQVTSYFPENSALQGGFTDRFGKCLQTVSDYLEGRSSFVSIAMDYTEQELIPDFTILKIPAIGAEFGDENMLFCKVDTGGSFIGHRTNRVDICAPNRDIAYNRIGKRQRQKIIKTSMSCREDHAKLPACK